MIYSCRGSKVIRVPGKKLRIAVIGCGRIGPTHMNAIKQLEDIARLVAVVDTDKDRAQMMSAEYGARCYYSVDEALGDSDIDAVVITLPNYLHGPVALKAAKSGKHILVEKPMVTSLDDADKIVKLADENGIILMVGQSRHYMQPLQEVKRLTKEIGKPITLSYTSLIHPSKMDSPQWWMFEEKTGKGGAVIWNMGSHTIDYTLWILEGSAPSSVYAKCHSNNPNFEGYDEAIIVLGFEDGAIATNHLSLNTLPPRHDCLIVGSKGSLYWKFGTRAPLRGHCGVWPNVELYRNGEIIAQAETVNPFTLEIKEFIDSIKERREPLTSGRKVRKTIEILDAIILSAYKDEVVYLK